jgi:hypothetical protein
MTLFPRKVTFCDSRKGIHFEESYLVQCTEHVLCIGFSVGHWKSSMRKITAPPALAIMNNFVVLFIIPVALR